MNDEAYEGLISLIYECVLDEAAWPRLLGHLATASGRRDGSLFLWDRGNGSAPKASTISLCTPEMLRDYDDYYGVIDPAQEFMVGRECGSWYHDIREYGKERMERDAFYQDFFREHDLGFSSSIKLYEHAGAGVYLSLLTARDVAVPSVAQQQILDRLSPHLRQAARLSERLMQLELGLGQRQLLLEQSATPQWLVEANGRVLFCNAAAERHMGERGFPLRLSSDRLVAEQLPSLPGVIRVAAGGSISAPRSAWLRLPRLNTELLVTPFRADNPLISSCQRPLALVVLLENKPRSELLSELFQLSPAESRLAGLIAQGLSPEDCAARLGVSINTVRSQLRALFRKTDTERQAELVSLFTRLG